MLVCSVQIISLLDNQSKFLMFTLFFRAILVYQNGNKNMAAPYWKFARNIFHEYI